VKRAVLLCGSLLVAGCSSNDTTTPPASSDASVVDATTDAPFAPPGYDAAGGTDAPVVHASPCQPLEPIPDAPCPAAGVQCEYGKDPHAVCWTLAYCGVPPDGGTTIAWVDDEPDPSCAPANDARCPAAFGVAASCPADPLRCDYAEGRCTCVDCATADGGEGRNWACRKWTDTGTGGTAGPTACPANRPHLGDPCGPEGTTCFYDGACTGIALGPAMQCKDGYWIGTVDPGLACAVRTCAQ
jgi:hypothetical protein